MKNNRILRTMIALLILLAFFFVQGAAAVAGHLEGTTSALVRGGIIWLLVICTLLYFAVRHKSIAALGFCRPKEGSLKKLLFCVPLIVIALSHFAAGPASGLSIGLFAAVDRDGGGDIFQRHNMQCMARKRSL